MSKSERNTLNQRVYSRLRQLLLNGHLSPGTQLDERILAEKMGVSRTPLREAIGHLAREGIVEYRPYRGNFVRTFTAKQVKDLYQVRKALESLAMRLAIPKLSQEHIEEIGMILAKVEEALARGDMTAYAEADRQFHNAFLYITGNEPLIDALERLAAQIQVVRTLANRDPEVVERTAKERPLILAALTARDTDAAVRLMEEHIEGVAKAVVAQIEQLEREA
ncbi:MAG: GntR family transcriptional regulator [Caldilineaceae bacterium]